MKKQKITVDTIMSWRPCNPYDKKKIKGLIKGVCGDRKNITYKDILKLPIPENDKLWVLLRPEFIPERQLHEVGMWCWEEIARPIWEKHYPNDKRPHDAVATKRLWLDGKATDAELRNSLYSSMASSLYALLNIAQAAAQVATNVSSWDTPGAVAMATAIATSRVVTQAAAQESVEVAAVDYAFAGSFEKILKHVEEILKVLC